MWVHWLQWGKHHGFVNDGTWYTFHIISYLGICLKYKIHGPQIQKFFIKFIYLMTLYVFSFTLGFIFPLANLENHRNKICTTLQSFGNLFLPSTFGWHRYFKLNSALSLVQIYESVWIVFQQALVTQ